jgi:hypothetical protein
MSDQSLQLNRQTVITLSIEAAVHRIDLSDCSFSTLKAAPPGDTERSAQLDDSDDIVSACIENKLPGVWRWNDDNSQLKPPGCSHPVFKLTTKETIRLWVSSYDCQISAVRTDSAINRCDSNCGVCTGGPQGTGELPRPMVDSL